MRGNLRKAIGSINIRGSIPACTGEPPERKARTALSRVYPRVYGGTKVPRYINKPVIGLSPRVRGNRPARAFIGACQRSIPACTGEPCHARGLAGCLWVYPRVYGGTKAKPLKFLTTKGLSPRVRGNRICLENVCGIKRSIPACTGEPTGGRWTWSRIQVYPRVYGGTRLGFGGWVFVWGLSPRVRGNHLARVRLHTSPWSIPACTGEPNPLLAPRSTLAVYPRVYGGTLDSKATTQARAGLSPRVRGNPLIPGVWQLHLRSIPACTGEPFGRF